LSLDKILMEVELHVCHNLTWILFMIIDKAQGGGILTGMIGLVNASQVNLSAEIAWITMFPTFQHMYVTLNMIGLILHYCLELPTTPQWPRLGL
jgi:hypothetical protein